MLSFTLFLALLACAPVSSEANQTVHQSSPIRGGVGEVTELYPDQDGDGYGDAEAKPIVASYFSGYVDNNGDCNDAEAKVNPGTSEVCDGVDNNCNGAVDDKATDQSVWYPDFDGDGHGREGGTIESCDDAGPEHYVGNEDDCDDDDATVFPGAPEACDGLDNDCNSLVDDNPSVGTTTYTVDDDGDGYGSAAEGAATIQACSRPAGYIPGNTDCDDTKAHVHPGGDEFCNELDDDCDGEVDNHPVEGQGTLYYKDDDADGYGDATFSQRVCNDPGDGWASNGNDCNPYDGTVNPDAEEVCDDQDNDCDGQSDEDIPDADMVTIYFDGDFDGYGDMYSIGIRACMVYWSYADNEDDCDDYDNMVNPGAYEIPDGRDNDCDGSVD